MWFIASVNRYVAGTPVWSNGQGSGRPEFKFSFSHETHKILHQSPYLSLNYLTGCCGDKKGVHMFYLSWEEQKATDVSQKYKICYLIQGRPCKMSSPFDNHGEWPWLRGRVSNLHTGSHASPVKGLDWGAWEETLSQPWQLLVVTEDSTDHNRLWLSIWQFQVSHCA